MNQVKFHHFWTLAQLLEINDFYGMLVSNNGWWRFFILVKYLKSSKWRNLVRNFPFKSRRKFILMFFWKKTWRRTWVEVLRVLFFKSMLFKVYHVFMLKKLTIIILCCVSRCLSLVTIVGIYMSASRNKRPIKRWREDAFKKANYILELRKRASSWKLGMVILF